MTTKQAPAEKPEVTMLRDLVKTKGTKLGDSTTTKLARLRLLLGASS